MMNLVKTLFMIKRSWYPTTRSDWNLLYPIKGSQWSHTDRPPVPAPQDQAGGQNEHLDSAFLPVLRMLAQKLNSYIQRQVIHDCVVGIEQ